jgi:AcrR family transcriptional regulator
MLSFFAGLDEPLPIPHNWSMHSNSRQKAHAPQQARSRATRERILSALLRLLETRGFDQISVAELTNMAPCSMSSFYARFPTKQALFEGCLEHFFEYSDEHARTAFGRLTSASFTPHQRVQGLVEFQLGSYRAHRGILRGLILHDRTHPDAGFGKRALSYKKRFFEAVAAVLLAGRADAKDPQVLASLRFGLWLVVHAVEQIVLFDDPIIRGAPLDGQQLIAELVEVLLHFVERPRAGKGKA